VTRGPPRPAAGAPVSGKGVPWSRTGKRPRQRAPRGSRQAAALLSNEQVLARLRLDEEALDSLQKCCTTRPPRNAAAIVSAIKARLEYSQPKPKQEVEVSGRVTLEALVVGSLPNPGAS